MKKKVNVLIMAIILPVINVVNKTGVRLGRRGDK